MSDGEGAAALKEKGNAKFKAGEYQAAVEAYTQSLELEPGQHLCYSNRSAAYLKLGGSAEQALRDAEQCVALAPNWAKGYSRQAAALQELKRWEDALAACERGISLTSDDSLRKTLEEVQNRRFCSHLQGTWHGTVTADLGGYDQEMEFLDSASVRVEVLGRSIIGRYWVNATVDPHHLNIQVPMQDMPPGMPAPPAVPYIARVDDAGLHICCPYMRLERPDKFEGPGYCLMAPGSLGKDDNAEIGKLSYDEQLRLCARELTAALPDSKLEEVQQDDDEDHTRDKLMAQVKFESSMFAVQKRFGEVVMKEVLGATKGGGEVPKALEDAPELRGLISKLRNCGILDDGDAARQVASPADGGAQSLPAAASAASPVAAKANSVSSGKAGPGPPAEKAAAPSGSSSSGLSPQTSGLVAVGLIAAATIGLLIWHRRRQ